MDHIIESLPEYAKDLKLNYSSLVRQDTVLTEAQRWGTVVACAMATKNAALIRAAIAEAAAHVSPEVLNGAKAAAAIMGMNNIYYRFHHLTSNEKYATMPARLRMNVMRAHGADPVDFELWCTAVSAINGCGKCVDSHERVLREKGMTEDHILQAVRIASILNAIGGVLTVEEALASPHTVSA